MEAQERMIIGLTSPGHVHYVRPVGPVEEGRYMRLKRVLLHEIIIGRPRPEFHIKGSMVRITRAAAWDG